MSKKNQIVSTQVFSRAFSYNLKAKDGVNVELNFTLRVDVPDQLEIFDQLLTAAQADVRAQIAQIPK